MKKTQIILETHHNHRVEPFFLKDCSKAYSQHLEETPEKTEKAKIWA